MTHTWTNNHRRFANRLMRIGAIKLKGPDNPRGFSLKIHETQPELPWSPIYLNLRNADNPNPGSLEGDDYLTSACLMYDFMRRLSFDIIGALPNAGTPFGEAISKLPDLAPWQGMWPKEDLPEERFDLAPFTKVFLTDGKRQIQLPPGSIAVGTRVVLVDDLVTQAKTKEEGIVAVQAQGGIVTDLVVLVDRGQGGAEELAKLGVTVHSVFTLRDLLDYYLEQGTIEQPIYQEIMEYLYPTA